MIRNKAYIAVQYKLKIWAKLRWTYEVLKELFNIFGRNVLFHKMYPVALKHLVSTQIVPKSQSQAKCIHLAVKHACKRTTILTNGKADTDRLTLALQSQDYTINSWLIVLKLSKSTLEKIIFWVNFQVLEHGRWYQQSQHFYQVCAGYQCHDILRCQKSSKYLKLFCS